MSGSETKTPAGGWQPDPSGRHELRYWSGTGWTDDVSDRGVTGKDPLQAAAPAVAPPYGQAMARGPIGKPTSAGTQILLSIVTLGIWSAVWTYRQHDDIKKYSGDGVGGWLGLVILLVVGIVTPFLLSNEIQTKLYEKEGQQSPIQTSAGAWVLIPLVGGIIWYLKAQQALNDFWVARGAAPV